MKKIISFFFVAVGLMISAQGSAEKVASVTIGETVTEYATLADAVAAAEKAGEGLIQLLPAYSETAYPQAWVTPCTIEFPDSLGFKDNTKSLYTFHAYNPNNDDERIGEAKAAGTLSEQADIARFAEILKEVDPAFDPTGKDIANYPFVLLKGYAQWHADFEVCFDTDIKAEDYVVIGNYEDYGWRSTDQNDQSISKDMKQGEYFRLIQNYDQNLKYWELLNSVRSFHCGIISLNDTLNAGKTYFVNLYLYAEGNEKIKILVKTTRFAFPAIVDEQYKVDVDPTVLVGKSEEEVVVVEKLMNSNFAAQGNNVDEATAGYSTENDKFIEVKLDAAEVSAVGDTAAVTSSVFDVKPMMAIITEKDTTYQVIPNSAITSPITFRLPVDEALIGQKVKVSHKGDKDPSYVLLGEYTVNASYREDGTISGAYVEISCKEFSLFKIETITTPTSFKEVKAAISAKKAILNGQLVIIKEGKLFNAQGAEL